MNGLPPLPGRMPPLPVATTKPPIVPQPMRPAMPAEFHTMPALPKLPTPPQAEFFEMLEQIVSLSKVGTTGNWAARAERRDRFAIGGTPAQAMRLALSYPINHHLWPGFN